MRERLSDCLPNLLEQLLLGLEELVIIPFSHDQCRLIRCLNDTDTVICRKRRDERDRLFDMRCLASKRAVTSEKAGRIDALRAQRANLLDIRLLLERRDIPELAVWFYIHLVDAKCALTRKPCNHKVPQLK